MPFFVLKGALLQCSRGDEASFLEVTDPKGEGYMAGKNVANIEDCWPLTNIQPFGQCRSLLNPSVLAATTANNGVLKTMPCVFPCAPAGVLWENGTDPKLYIRGASVLMNDATLYCRFGGTIEVTDEYKGEVEAGVTSGLTLDLDGSIFGGDYDRGPGTKYINEYGRLLYQRRDGAAGRVLIVLDNDVSRLENGLRQVKKEGQLNDPDNYYLLGIGMTGEQYTKPKKFPYIDYQNAYEDGYSGDSSRISRRETQIGGLAASQIVDDEMWVVKEIVKDGLNDGISDREKGLIDRFHPTVRITGSPLIVL